LTLQLQKKNIPIISSEYSKLENNQKITVSNHPEYSNNIITHLDSYKKTLIAKFNDTDYSDNVQFNIEHPNGYDRTQDNYSQISSINNF